MLAGVADIGNEIDVDVDGDGVGGDEHDDRAGDRGKPAWRRFLEVAVPVAVFAIATPLIVNGIANAVHGGDAAPSSVADTATTTAAGNPDTAPTTTTAPETTLTIPGLDGSADARTKQLGAQIVAEANATASTPTTAAIDSASTPTTATTATASTTATSGHSHGVVTPEVELTRAERAALADQLLRARAAAEAHPTVADALADGYTMVTGYVPLIGAHYIKWSLMDGNFDVDHPEMLLYDGTDQTSTIVGLSYYLFSDVPPSPFAGPNDHWHQHVGLCIKDGVVVGGEQTTVEECTKRGGAKAMTSNGWMVHAWVVPGWESPQGVFSPEHPGLTAALANS